MPFVAWLEAQVDETGPELPGETTVAAFRLETATAILRFIDRMLDICNAGASRAEYSAVPRRVD